MPAVRKNLIQVFLDKRSSGDNIKSAGVKLFEFLFQNPNSKSHLTLHELRYHKFMRMAARGVVSPKDLPPSVGAAEQHALRAYIQISDWLTLTPKSLDPESFGWKLVENIYTPIDLLGPMAPEGLLKLISCGCKTDCSSNHCSCVKANLKCLSACTTCRGITCENADVCIEDDESDCDDYENN